jgi:hypothetical protein
MTPHAYTEDQFVERPAIWLFATRGSQTVSAFEENCGSGRSPRRSFFARYLLEWTCGVHA